ncbi:hypothetical protein NM208_g9120 [Fusarium decemcellulare]|uniref:Uncharacterized protein n=1 Tax=Fusarium decemcellulare TaxID=57161 RepID=A0ACC1S2U6_9HYPO|nr:hypothetical protein NM208_g9120 [Fusarium decemcellulare]
MKSRRYNRSKSIPTENSPKKSFLTVITRRLSLSAIRRPNSQRLSDEDDDDEEKSIRPEPQEIPLEVESPPASLRRSITDMQQPLSPISLTRVSRRASRFWSISSANYFEDNTPAPSSSPPAYEGSAYVPRHAAADFNKTASNRLTVMIEADETTLCSFNCDPSRNHLAVNYDDEYLDDEDAMLHREEALAALTASTRSRSIAATGDDNNDYTLFLAQAAANQEARARDSAAAWAELEHRTMWASRRTSGAADPLISRQSRGHSAYLGVPASISGSSRPVSSIAISIAEYIRPSHASRAW